MMMKDGDHDEDVDKRMMMKMVIMRMMIKG